MDTSLIEFLVTVQRELTLALVKSEKTVRTAAEVDDNRFVDALKQAAAAVCRAINEYVNLWL